MADQVIADDLIVTGSACVGFDCVNNENFGFDTLVLKENNLRIFFDDTSNSSSFPANDWRIVINDSANGGSSFFLRSRTQPQGRHCSASALWRVPVAPISEPAAAIRKRR
ncbi:hypothetical protein [Tabrizicola sp.]|uniref:hypothetical protein n=1 Tax=Tabrizicola sp. TaxID=2005166 RepID=UPI00261CE28A|nr:hypothetical protein [Tabrizicola sp.]MDM7930876.1 hypothetical protein [Tabrizicola sp.]